MKTAYLSLLLVVTIMLSAGMYFNNEVKVPGEFQLENGFGKIKNKQPKAMRAKEAMEWRAELLKDENGEYKHSYYINALKEARQLRAANSSRSSLGLQWEELGPDNVGGRVRGIVIDNRDPTRRTIWAGGVAGGIWKSTDAANSWTFAGCCEYMAIAHLQQAPNGDIYAGTGEGLAQIGGTSLNSAQAGNGIYVLRNGSSTWEHLPATAVINPVNNTEDWTEVNRIAINPSNSDHLIVGTAGGLYQSFDAGMSFTKISQVVGLTNSAQVMNQRVADVKWSKDDPSLIFASVVNGNRLIRSTDMGGSWTSINTTNTGFPSTRGRLEIGLAPSSAEHVYVMIADAGQRFGCTFGLYGSTNRGETWTELASRGPLFDPFLDQCQGWFDNVIAVSPVDPEKVYIGGVDFYTYSPSTGVKLADVGLGGRDDNPNYIHPDKHAIEFNDLNPEEMYIGCDGGIYRSNNALSSFPFPTYRIRNRGFNVTQFYSIAASETGEVVGGTQDNGTQYINMRGNTRRASTRVYGGDGIYTDISKIDPAVMLGGVYFGTVRRSSNRGGSWSPFFDIKIDIRGDGTPTVCGGQNNAIFITPFLLHETKSAWNGNKFVSFTADRNYASGDQITLQSATANYPYTYTLQSNVTAGQTIQVPDPIRSRFFLSTNCGVFMTEEVLDFSVVPKWFKLHQANLNGIALSFSASKDGDVLYVGTSTGRVYRFGGLNSATLNYPPGTQTAFATNITVTNTSVGQNRRVEGISVDQNNSNHVLATLAGFPSATQASVVRSLDGAATFTALSNGLPRMPVYDCVIDAANSQNYIIASELGMWSSSDQGATWNDDNAGMYGPNGEVYYMPCFRLRQEPLYEDVCQVLYVGTHGRGLWRSTTLSENLGCNLVANVSDKSAAKVMDMDIFPNPVEPNSKVAVNLTTVSNVTVRIIDMPGRLIREKTFKNVSAGDQVLDMDFSGLSRGNYLVNVMVGKESSSRLINVSR